MASAADIAGIQQTGVAVLSEIQQALVKAVPTNSSGHLEVNTLVQPGFTRVLGVSVVTAGAGLLHDCAALPDAGPSNVIYAVPSGPGFYPTNMVFHKGLVLIAGAAKCAIMYSRT